MKLHWPVALLLCLVGLSGAYSEKSMSGNYIDQYGCMVFLLEAG
jgi:hypothetical protein